MKRDSPYEHAIFEATGADCVYLSDFFVGNIGLTGLELLLNLSLVNKPVIVLVNFAETSLEPVLVNWREGVVSKKPGFKGVVVEKKLTLFGDAREQQPAAPVAF